MKIWSAGPFQHQRVKDSHISSKCQIPQPGALSISVSLLLKWIARRRRRDNQDKKVRDRGRIWEFSCSQTKINCCFRNALGPVGAIRLALRGAKPSCLMFVLFSIGEIDTKQNWNSFLNNTHPFVTHRGMFCTTIMCVAFKHILEVLRVLLLLEMLLFVLINWF